MFGNILVASDSSESAGAAMRAAVEIARQFGSHLTVITVFDPPIAPTYSGVASPGYLVDPTIYDQLARQAEQSLEAQTRQMMQATGAAYDYRHELGHPADRIIAVAEEIGADLIVVGSRGMGALKAALVGSVSDRVLHHAHCPVLVVR